MFTIGELDRLSPTSSTASSTISSASPPPNSVARDFSAPHFVLFESTADPFAGVVSRLFAHADYPFQLVRIQPGDAVRSFGVPLGKLPALQLDGITLAGFSTICRAVATRIGLDGHSTSESNEIDMIVSFIETEMDRLRPVMTEEASEEEIDAEVDHFLTTLAPFLDARFKSSGSAFIVGKNLTWADFVLVNFLHTVMDYGGASILLNFPHLSYYYESNERIGSTTGV